MARLLRPDTAFASTTKQKRVQKPAYLAWLRTQPCVVCHTVQNVQAAHIRSKCLRLGKGETGMGEKSDDAWSVPLCENCHVMGPGAQHSMGEMDFWKSKGIDPFTTALALHRAWADDDDKAATLVVLYAREK